MVPPQELIIATRTGADGIENCRLRQRRKFFNTRDEQEQKKWRWK
jgi:hypothetical protein